MPKPTSQTATPGRVTLSERVVATHLDDEHYAAQLIERLAWAAIDAEHLEHRGWA